jgi:hypothetical protein
MRGTIIKRGATYSVVLDLGRDDSGRRVRRWHSGYKTKEAERAQVELLARRPRRLRRAVQAYRRRVPT